MKIFYAVASASSFFTSSILLIGLMFFSSAQAENTAGSNCAPATLPQALNLNFTTNQFGVVNPLGNSSSFFVVCPIVHEADGTLYDAVAVRGNFESPTGGDIECAIRINNSGAPFTDITNITLSRASAGTAIGFGDPENPFSWNNDGNNTVICALEPGQSIQFVAALRDLS